MAHLPIQCQNCGAKYKIPETFAGDFAKCKACGTKIDVNAARSATSEAAPASSPRQSTKRSTGGSRKPRQTASASGGKSRRTGEDEESPKKRRTTGASSRRRGRGGDDGDDDEGGGRRRNYEKKKDNTVLVFAGSVLFLAVAAVVVFFVWTGSSDGETDPKQGDKVAAAKGEAGKAAADAAAKKADPTDPKEATGDEAGKAAEGAAKVEGGAAAKKDEPVKKPVKKKTPKVKPKKANEIQKPEDVFKPSTLAPLAKPEGLSDEDAEEINGYLDDLKEGGGLSYIRAPGKLAAKGAKMIPLAVTRMMTLDYSKVEDNQYAYAISEAIKQLTEFELAFDPARIPEDFKLSQGHTNALKVKDLHYLARRKWMNDDALAKDKAKRNK